LENRPEVVMLLPVLGHLLVDHASLLVPDRCRVAIGARRAVSRFPDVPLPTRPGMVADGELGPVLVLHHRDNVAVWSPLGGPFDTHPSPVEPVGIGVAVNVDDLVISEVDAIRAERPDATVEVGIE